MSIYEDTFFMIYCCLLAGVFGAVLGSFLNCAGMADRTWRILFEGKKPLYKLADMFWAFWI